MDILHTTTSGGSKRKPLHGSPIPLKKQRRMNCLTEIKNMKPAFSAERLQINMKYTQNAADDDLFCKPPCSKSSSYIRWVLACKFMIASQLRLSSYQILGMQRNRIPENMHFFVDEQQNLCAVLKYPPNHQLSMQIIHHCDNIETSVIQHYVAPKRQHQAGDEEDEDDDLCVDSTRTKQRTDCHLSSSSRFLMDDMKNKENEDAENQQEQLITIVRIPMLYYYVHIASSFYALCCRIAAYLNEHSLFGHPLFHLLWQTIANFDCFQSTVPMIPLKGGLPEMFAQFALSLYLDDQEKLGNAKNVVDQKQFFAFLGMYDVWRSLLYRRRCRKCMQKCWTRSTQTDANIMKIVVEYAELDEMTEQSMVESINQFDRASTGYAKYVKEIKSQIPNLRSIVDWNSFAA